MKTANSIPRSFKSVKGIKGPSVLFEFMDFNRVTSFVPDYMHSVLLGIVRQFLKLWFESSFNQMPWYIGNKAAKVDEKLPKIKPPHTLSRVPRSLSTNKFWKAHEWYSWMFYYSCIVLRGILPNVYLRHWAFLVQSVNVLTRDSICKSEVHMAHNALNYFISQTQDLYGKEH